MSFDNDSIYFYNPSLAAAVFFTALYVLPTIFLIYMTIRTKSYYLFCLPAGALVEVGGYAARIASVKNTSDVSSYAISSSLIVVAPLFIAAADYLLLGRLMLFVLPESSQKLFGLHARFVTRVFVGCDIASFLIQCSGSGVAASQSWVGNTGIDILLAGLSLQLITNTFFIILIIGFYNKTFVNGYVTQTAPSQWKAVFWAIASTIVLILIRSIYRLAEFALGFNGYPFTHEWIFYVLEAIPMLFAITIFCIWFPGDLLPFKPKRNGNSGIEAGKEVSSPEYLNSGSHTPQRS